MSKSFDYTPKTTATPMGSSPEPGAIITLAEYKTRRQITEASPEADEATQAALWSAEDAVLQYTGRDFTTAQGVQAREYSWEIHSMILEIDDFVGRPSALTFEVPGIGGVVPFVPGAYWVGPNEGITNYYLDFTPTKQLSSYSIGVMGFTRNLDTYFARGGGEIDAVNVFVTAEFGWPGESPPSIKQAVTWLVDEFNAPDKGGEELESESIAQLSYTYQREPTKERVATLPPRVQQLLDPYRRIAL